MLREQAKIFNRLSLLVDATIVLIAFACAYYFRISLPGTFRGILEYSWILVLVLPVWGILLFRQGLYASIRRYSTFDILTRLINVHFFGGLAVAAVILFLDREQYSRGLFLLFLLFSFIFLTVEKVCVRYFLGMIRRRGYNTRNILIIGAQEKAQKFSRLVDAHRDWGLNVIGFLQVADGPLQDNIEGCPIIGHADALVETCKNRQVDEVVFCLPSNYVVNAEEHLQDLEELGITVRIVMDFFDLPLYRREISLFHNELPILTYHPRKIDAQQLLIKRIFDVAGSLLGLVITVTLFPFIALAIKLDSRGPLFFGQKRVGINGRLFKCLKFRSMYIDAEERKSELMAQNEMNGAIFKIKDDPRVTKVGRFLRKTSLDELPQFWNVFIGDMSLVGTRPPTPEEVEQYENWHRRRICIKPGISGMWQVSGRNRIEDFDKIVRLDLLYIDNWSFWLDIKILLKTILVVFRREGSS